MMALIFLRMVVQAVACLVLLVGGLIMVGIGNKSGALNLAVVCGVIIVGVRPDPDDVAAFERFQKDRIAGPPP